MLSRILILTVFAGIVVSLGSALVYFVKDKGDSDRMAKALTVRVSISILLFGLLFVLWGLGLIQPHGLTPQN